MTADVEKTIAKIRELYAEEARPGLPRFGYFDREDVGVLLSVLDAGEIAVAYMKQAETYEEWAKRMEAERDVMREALRSICRTANAVLAVLKEKP